MTEPELKIKLEFISGLKEVVINEIKQFPNLNIIKIEESFIHLDFTQDISLLKDLRSILRAFIIIESYNYNPPYINNHKSIIGNMISLITKEDNSFETFKIICAGSDSLIIQSISDYIQSTYGLTESEDADMKIHIIKNGGIWEVGAQISPKPLSVRSYKVRDMEGAMNPTIAYAVNSLCGLESVESYLNIFSGSATLLIEAGQCYKNIKQLIGFDNNKEALSLSIKNIKEAGLIKVIKVKEADIFDKPSFGMFDAITADLPFGMLVSKFENLETLYQSFIEYSRKTLKDEGVLVVYTVKSDMLKKIIKQSEFKIINSLKLELITSTKAFIYPSIFVCKLK